MDVHGEDHKDIPRTADDVEPRTPTPLLIKIRISCGAVGSSPYVIRHYAIPKECAVGPPSFKPMPPGWICVTPDRRAIPPNWDAIPPKDREPVVDYEVPVPNVPEMPVKEYPPNVIMISGNDRIPKGWKMFFRGWQAFLPGWIPIPPDCVAMPPTWKSVPRDWQLIPTPLLSRLSLSKKSSPVDVNGKDEKDILRTAVVNPRPPSAAFLKYKAAAALVRFSPDVVRRYAVPEEYAVGPPNVKSMPPGWMCVPPDRRVIPPDWDAIPSKEGKSIVDCEVPVPNVPEMPVLEYPPNARIIFGNNPIPKGWHEYLRGWRIFQPGWSPIPPGCVAVPPTWKTVPRDWQLIPPPVHRLLRSPL